MHSHSSSLERRAETFFFFVTTVPSLLTEDDDSIEQEKETFDCLLNLFICCCHCWSVSSTIPFLSRMQTDRHNHYVNNGTSRLLFLRLKQKNSRAMLLRLSSDWFSTCDARYPLTGKTISLLTWYRRHRLRNSIAQSERESERGAPSMKYVINSSSSPAFCFSAHTRFSNIYFCYLYVQKCRHRSRLFLSRSALQWMFKCSIVYRTVKWSYMFLPETLWREERRRWEERKKAEHRPVIRTIEFGLNSQRSESIFYRIFSRSLCYSS